ncbi:hypothetical protein QBC47DRAFT_385089 [Echria macrotheca]|uniref:Uncharacterized protein n=1 Tax=Echria macrotheca TaxID=438768 RepID=A0AAJ0BB86_9PEZI|nr:hypothetical protein QBC47DRAFT_385089 [Echria macrotheca]
MDADKLMIVSHAHVTYDNLPLSKGYRVLMSYSLYHSNVKNNADEENSLVKELTDMTTQLELALFNQIKTWADHLRATHPGNEDRDPEAFPILFVLEGDYNQVDLAIDNLTAPDRAKAAALRNVKIRSFRGYKLQTFLVSVKATVKNYYGSSNTTVRYAVDRAASLGGMPKPKRVRDTVIDERGVAQREEFTKDAEVKRQVTESMNTTTKTRTVSFPFFFFFLFPILLPSSVHISSRPAELGSLRYQWRLLSVHVTRRWAKGSGLSFVRCRTPADTHGENPPTQCLMLILEPWPTAKNPHRHQGRA